MKRSVFTYLRTSAFLRVFSAFVFIALTGASVSASVCSYCAIVQTNSANQTESCPLAQDGVAQGQRRAACCCSHARAKTNSVSRNNKSSSKTLRATEAIQQKSMSCCADAKKSTESASTASNLRTTSAQTGAVDFTKPLSCQLSGSCPRQMRTDTHKSSSPPPRNLEQEHQNNLNISIQTAHISQFIERSIAPNHHFLSALSGGPPNLSGIGSQLLLC